MTEKKLVLTANNNFMFMMYLCARHFAKPWTGIILCDAHNYFMSTELSLP